MTKLIILGTARAVPDEDHENTHMVLVGEKHVIMVDCVSNPIMRLDKAGVDFNSLTDLILTHFHPDHVSGVPLLLMNMWLLGRRRPLSIFGLHHTLDRIESLMGFYAWEKWPDFFSVIFHRLPNEEMTSLIDDEEYRIFASPVCHLIPTIGIRVEFPQTGKTMAYSCDTEPCDAVQELASGVDVLIHEATGETTGHSSASQAGEAASKADVGSLYLIHYPTRDFDSQLLVAEAEKTFPGPVALAKDFMELDF